MAARAVSTAQPAPCSQRQRRRGASSRCSAVPQRAEPELASRRAALALLAACPAAAAAAAAAEELLPALSAATDVDTTVTHTLLLDVGLCPEAVRTDRTLGDKTPFCSDPAPLGQLTVQLFGRAAPGSVAAIVAAARAGAYDSTQLSKVLPGRFIVAGAQGPKRSGLVQAPPELPPNPDLLSPAAFRLPHLRPGTVSLNLSENVDEEFIRLSPGYRNLSLLITTGPGPVPSLDGENIVVGQLTPESLAVVRAITAVPTFTPNGNARAFNDFARFIGDERADKTRAKWGRPLQAIVITAAVVV